MANINFRYERIFEYIYIQKTIRMNIRICSYQKDDTNEYPNIFVSKKQYEWISKYIRIKKMIRIWYERILISEHIRMYKIFDISFRLDARGWIFDVWYNRKLKHSWHNKIEVIFLWTLIFVWTIWAIYLLDLLAQTLDFSLEYIRIKKRYERISEYIRIKKMIRTNIRIYLYQKDDTNDIRIYSYQKSNTNEYPNIFVSKNWWKEHSELCLRH